MYILQVLSHGIGKQHGLSASSNVQKESVVTSNFLKSKSQKIKSFMSWNGYPSYVRNSVLKKLKDRKKHSEKRPTNFEDEDIGSVSHILVPLERN